MFRLIRSVVVVFRVWLMEKMFFHKFFAAKLRQAPKRAEEEEDASGESEAEEEAVSSAASEGASDADEAEIWKVS